MNHLLQQPQCPSSSSRHRHLGTQRTFHTITRRAASNCQCQRQPNLSRFVARASSVLPTTSWSGITSRFGHRRGNKLIRTQTFASDQGQISAPLIEAPEESFGSGVLRLVEVVALLASIGSAILSLTGVISSAVLTYLPIVLPIVALMASLGREAKLAQANAARFASVCAVLQSQQEVMWQSRDVLNQVHHAVETSPAAVLMPRVTSIDKKLTSMEEYVRSMGRYTHDAASRIGLLSDQVGRELGRGETVAAVVRQELDGVIMRLSSQEASVLARLEARIAGVENMLTGIEMVQGESLRRLSQINLDRALHDAVNTIEVSVQNELARSLEPVRQLSGGLAALPAPSTPAPQLPAASEELQQWKQDLDLRLLSLQEAVTRDVQSAAQQIMDVQTDTTRRLGGVREVLLSEEQWSALGVRLTRLERMMDPPLFQELLQDVQSSVAETLRVQLEDLNSSVQQGVASELTAIQADLASLREVGSGAGGLEAELPPLVAAVNRMQESLASISTPAAPAPAPSVSSDEAVQKLLDSIHDVTNLSNLLVCVDQKLEQLSTAVASTTVSPTSAAASTGESPQLSQEALAASTKLLEAVTQLQEGAEKQQNDMQELLRKASTSTTEAVGKLADQVGDLGFDLDTQVAKVTEAAKQLHSLHESVAAALAGTLALLQQQQQLMNEIQVQQKVHAAVAAAAADHTQSQAESNQVVRVEEAPPAASLPSMISAGVAVGGSALTAALELTVATADEPVAPAAPNTKVADGLEPAVAEPTQAASAPLGPVAAAVSSDEDTPRMWTRGGNLQAGVLWGRAGSSFDDEDLPSIRQGIAGTDTATATVSTAAATPSTAAILTMTEGALIMTEGAAVVPPTPPLWSAATQSQDLEPAQQLPSSSAVAAVPVITPTEPGLWSAATQSQDLEATQQLPGISMAAAVPVITPTEPGLWSAATQSQDLEPAQQLPGSSAVAAAQAVPSSQAASLWSAPNQEDELEAAEQLPSSSTYWGRPAGSDTQSSFAQSSFSSASPSDAPYATTPGPSVWGGREASQQDTAYQNTPLTTSPSTLDQPYLQPPTQNDSSSSLAVPSTPAPPLTIPTPAPAYGMVSGAQTGGEGIGQLATNVSFQDPQTSTSSSYGTEPSIPSVEASGDAAQQAFAPAQYEQLPTAQPQNIPSQSTYSPDSVNTPPSTTTTLSWQQLQQQEPQQQQWQQWPPAQTTSDTTGPQLSSSQPALPELPPSRVGQQPPTMAADSPPMQQMLGGEDVGGQERSWQQPPSISNDESSRRGEGPLGEEARDQLLTEGLQFLRNGREETQQAQDFALAENYLQRAAASFQTVIDRNPQDTKAIGNLGNALLAIGQLRVVQLDGIRSQAAAAGQLDPNWRVLQAQLTSEANQYLTSSGDMFRSVLEVGGWSSRALVNWGRAMCMRAELATNPGVVEKLYQAAIDKFDAVLEEEPDMLPAKFRCALALKGLAQCRATTAQDAGLLLQDAITYLQEVLSSNSVDADSLQEASLQELQSCEQLLQANSR